MQKISPFLWYDTQAEEAARLYVSIFGNGRIVSTSQMITTFELEGQGFTAMNGGPGHKFSDAISLLIHCQTQSEVDYFWDKLIANGGEESMCGWLKDKFALSWQVVPDALIEYLNGKDAAGAQRAMQAMLEMHKIDIAALKHAYEGK